MAVELPQDAQLVELSATYNEKSIPRSWRIDHPLPYDRWGKLIVDEGEVLVSVNGGAAQTVAAGESLVIPPSTPFRMEPGRGAARFCMHYFHPPVLSDPDALVAALGR